MSKPLIGLPGRRKTGEQVDGFPPSLRDIEMDVFLADYSRGVLQAGGLPINIPLDADPVEYLPHLSGIVLTGGADIEPSVYGHDADGNGAYEPARDRLELSLLGGALSADLPILAICRGIQVLNVHAGGDLNQHVPEHACFDLAPSAHAHRVTFETGSRLHELFGPSADVNSLHHQTIDEVGEDLTVTARADDGTIEGVEFRGRPVLGVQWHPEMLTSTDPLFGWLVEQARCVPDRS